MNKKSLEKYYGNDRATKAIYGVILIFAFLVGQSHTHVNNASSLAFSTFFAAVAIVLAEIYAEILGKTIRNKRMLSKIERNEIEKDSFAIMSVSLWPSLFFGLSYFRLFSLQAAFNISYVLLLSLLFLFSFWASRLSKFNKTKSFVIALMTSSMGLLVVALKYWFGH